MQDKLKEQLEKYCWNEHHFEPLANYERLESFIDQNFIGKEEVELQRHEFFNRPYYTEGWNDLIDKLLK